MWLNKYGSHLPLYRYSASPLHYYFFRVDFTLYISILKSTYSMFNKYWLNKFNVYMMNEDLITWNASLTVRFSVPRSLTD